MKDSIGIIGAGSFGTALASLVGREGTRVILWSRTAEVVEEINRERTNQSRLRGAELPASVVATGDPGELAAGARFLVLAVAPADARDRARRLGEVTDGRHLAVHAIGALADPDDVRVSEVLAAETPIVRIGAIAGPALPGDLLRAAFASMVCASEFDEVTREARRLLSVPRRLRLYESRDLAGVELSSALSSAYTVALGLTDALELGPGPRAILVTRAVAEGGRIASCAGGEPRTFAGLAGLGNLLVRSATSVPGEGSASYHHGLALARGAPVDNDRAPVGVRAATALLRLADRQGERAPVLRALVAVLEGERTPLEAAAMAADTVASRE
jgi:glycerol-3-phosphate dehydrogenase (NAD(P)+)